MQRKRKTLAKPSLEADVKQQVTGRGGASCVTSGLQMDVILGGGLMYQACRDGWLPGG